MPQPFSPISSELVDQNENIDQFVEFAKKEFHKQSNTNFTNLISPKNDEPINMVDSRPSVNMSTQL